MFFCEAYLIHNNDPVREINRKNIKKFLKAFSIDTTSIYRQDEFKEIKNRFINKSKIISNKLNYFINEYNYQILISKKSKLF